MDYTHIVDKMSSFCAISCMISTTKRENKAQRSRIKGYKHTVCPRSLDPFHIVSHYIKWVKTPWTYNRFKHFNISSMKSLFYLKEIEIKAFELSGISAFFIRYLVYAVFVCQILFCFTLLTRQ